MTEIGGTVRPKYPNTPELAKEIVQATMEGSNLPVSVKTRSGIKQHQTETWISHLLETKPAAITLHGRTQKDMSEVPAEWEEAGKAARVRDEIHPDTLIFGNGDIQSLEEAHEKTRQYNLDGAMIARGIFANPWIFNPGYQPSLDERLDTLLLHTQLFDDYWQNDRNFAVLRRFYKIYIQGFPGASKLRAALMQTQNSEEVKEVIEKFRKEVLFATHDLDLINHPVSDLDSDIRNAKNHSL